MMWYKCSFKWISEVLFGKYLKPALLRQQQWILCGHQQCCQLECLPRQLLTDKQYMNYKAVDNQAYVPTDVEHLANILTHGFCILPSFIGLHFMIQQSISKIQLINSLLYGFTLVALFSISTIFHSVFYLGKCRRLKEVLHRCDRAIIYIFIAASYTPWLTLKYMEPGIGNHIRWLIWLFAFMGIIYQQLYHEKYKWLETLFYFLLGVVPSLVIFQMPEWSGLFELAIGGGIYILGIYFFKSDGQIPCAHAIWHIFVIAAASFHFYAVCRYLLGTNNEKRAALPLIL